jgi:small subunit ribosomal protein S1
MSSNPTPESPAPVEPAATESHAPTGDTPHGDAPVMDAAAPEPGEWPPSAPNDDPAADASEGSEEADDDGDGDGDGESDGDGDAAAEGDQPTTAGEAPTGEAGAPKKKKKRRRKKKADGHHHASERAPFHVGEEVFGKVTAVLDTAIMIDLAGKALAIFDRGEMAEDDLVPAVDDRFVAKVLCDGGRGGLVVLTRKPLREEESKPKVEQAAKDGSPVMGLVTGVIKGGVEVLIDGLRAFAPASGMDLHPRAANFVNLVGQRLDFKVTSYEKHGQDVVVTRRPMLEKEAHERRKRARELLQEGMDMQGIVRTVVEWGAFVALPAAEYLEGLVHVSELSHNPRDRVTDVLKPGQKIDVRIQKIDEKGKIWLSRKALVEDPFAKLTEQLKPGAIVEGTVTRVEDFGAFIQIADGYEGLCHAADMGVTRVEDARKVMEAGQVVRVLVHHIDTRDRRIALHPAPTPEQEAEERQKVVRGQKLKVEIVKIEQVGLTVRILGATGRQARGFLPAGQTGTPRGAELRKHFTQGSVIEVLVSEIDPKRREPKLSVTKLAADEERKAHKEYQTKMRKESNFGTLGDLLKSKLGG